MRDNIACYSSFLVLLIDKSAIVEAMDIALHTYKIHCMSLVEYNDHISKVVIEAMLAQKRIIDH